MNRALTPVFVTASLAAIAGCSPTEDSPTTAAFASVVARNEKTIRNAADEKSTCFFAMTIESSEPEKQKCMKLADEGRSALIAVKDDFLRLGEPPTEINGLVERLIRGGEHLQEESAFDVKGKCDFPTPHTPTNEDCANAVNTVLTGLDEAIVPELDAWKPYI